MFSRKKKKKCWFLYQSEGLPYNLSIEEFCLKQGVPVNEFNKWYRDTNKRETSESIPDNGGFGEEQIY